ncbi:MAG: hypothetical protein D6681_10515 [Calditrichaeota bacterium]|nr:MAG: hypothetical protein D6681_10515 [Calditrichota bacterium]
MSLVAVLGMLLFWGCHRDDSPVEYGFGPEGPVPLMDRRVVGEWVSVSSGTHGAPYVSGWQITARGQLYDLGVEFSTGRLTRLPNAPVYHFQALDGKFRITRQVSEAHEQLLWEGRYEVTEDQLVLEFQDYRTVRRTLQKSQLGAVVTAPLISRLSAMVNGELLRTPEITHSPPATAVKITDNTGTHLRIQGWSMDSCEMDADACLVELYIADFSGGGAYPTGGASLNHARYLLMVGDAGLEFSTDSTHTGILHIERYDENAGICEGRFEFVGGVPQAGPQVPPVEVTEGHFQVPIYFQEG